MEEQHRLAMRADLRLAVAKHARAFLDQLVTRGEDVDHLVADMMNAAVGIALDELRNGRSLAQRLDELDLGIGQRHEHGDHAVLGQRHGVRNRGAECAAIDLCRLLRVLDRDRHMIKPAQHGSLPHTSRTWTKHSGFLPHSSLTAARTARRTDSASASGSRRRARGRPSTVDTTTSNTISSITSPAAFFSGTPTRSTSGSSASSPLSVTAMATKAQPANPIRRRSTTARDLDSSRIAPSL